MNTSLTARLVGTEDGQPILENTVTLDCIVTEFEARGFLFAGFNNSPHQRKELRGWPKFRGLCGPMWNGDSVRYETVEAYAVLST